MEALNARRRRRRRFLAVGEAVPRTGQDNNKLKKTVGPRLGREGSRGDPRSRVKNPSPGLLLPPRKEQRRLED